jgi:hypothetical protein
MISSALALPGTSRISSNIIPRILSSDNNTKKLIFQNKKILHSFISKYGSRYTGCSLKFPVKVGVEESIVNASWIINSVKAILF